MARIPEEVIGEVRDRTDIVAVVGERVQLRKSGGSFKGLCPFHQEKSPSFHVMPDKRFFHCFGCQKSGDIFKFVMELDGKSFVEAARELAARAGVTIPEQAETTDERARRDERAGLLELNAHAAAWFRETLQGPTGQKARDYLASRGIGDAVSETFKLGMAPDAWDGLVKRFESRKLPVEKAAVLGLVAPRTRGPGFYDRFRNRVMCPVILPAGEVVAFSARDLGGGTTGGEDVPKYINSTGSPIYTKGNVLFGLHAARPAFRKKGRAILVEGNFDVIALHQAGFDETIAPLGTALTDRQIETLRLTVPKLILCLDGDKAGRAAAMRDLVPLIAVGLDVRVLALPDGEDPDTMVRKLGPEGFEAQLQRARPGAEYFLHELFGKGDQTTDRRTQAIKECLPLLQRVTDETRRDLLIAEFAQGLGVDPRIIRRALSGQELPVETKRSAAPATDARFKSELEVLVFLADHPAVHEEARTLQLESLLTDARVRDMYSASQAGKPLHEVVPPELRNIVTNKVLIGANKNLTDPAVTLRGMAKKLKLEQLLAEVGELNRLKHAATTDDERRSLGLKEFDLRRQIEALKK